jgi:LacI family transcriptional regulator
VASVCREEGVLLAALGSNNPSSSSGKRGGASLDEVARRSGVSISTASRVLNPQSKHAVSEATRLRVSRVAKSLDFHPNGIARSFQARRSLLVAIVVHDVRDAYFNECARVASDTAAAAGYLSVICNTDRDVQTELRYVEMLRQNRVAGIMFLGGGLDDQTYRRDLKRHLTAMRDYGGAAIALGPRADNLPAEVPDNYGGARSATEHLLGLGHRHIGFIDGPEGLITSAERRRGYSDALAAGGREVRGDLIAPGGFSVDGGAKAMRALLERDVPFTAVFASNDAMAIGCLQVLRGAGLRVPKDVSLVGFDAVPVVSWVDPPITTVSVPMAEIGRAGAERLLSTLAGRGRRGPRVVVHPTRLIELGSTAPPSKARTKSR